MCGLISKICLLRGTESNNSNQGSRTLRGPPAVCQMRVSYASKKCSVYLDEDFALFIYDFDLPWLERRLPAMHCGSCIAPDLCIDNEKEGPSANVTSVQGKFIEWMVNLQATAIVPCCMNLRPFLHALVFFRLLSRCVSARTWRVSVEQVWVDQMHTRSIGDRCIKKTGKNNGKPSNEL